MTRGCRLRSLSLAPEYPAAQSWMLAGCTQCRLLLSWRRLWTPDQEPLSVIRNGLTGAVGEGGSVRSPPHKEQFDE